MGTDAEAAVVQDVRFIGMFVYLGYRCVSVVCAVTACGIVLSKLRSVGYDHR